MSSETVTDRETSRPGNTERYKMKLPAGLKPILMDLTRQAIQKKPKNLDVFFAEYFSLKLEQRARGNKHFTLFVAFF